VLLWENICKDIFLQFISNDYLEYVAQMTENEVPFVWNGYQSEGTRLCDALHAGTRSLSTLTTDQPWRNYYMALIFVLFVPQAVLSCLDIIMTCVSEVAIFPKTARKVATNPFYVGFRLLAGLVSGVGGLVVVFAVAPTPVNVNHQWLWAVASVAFLVWATVDLTGAANDEGTETRIPVTLVGASLLLLTSDLAAVTLQQGLSGLLLLLSATIVQPVVRAILQLFAWIWLLVLPAWMPVVAASCLADAPLSTWVSAFSIISWTVLSLIWLIVAGRACLMATKRVAGIPDNPVKHDWSVGVGLSIFVVVLIVGLILRPQPATSTKIVEAALLSKNAVASEWLHVDRPNTQNKEMLEKGSHSVRNDLAVKAEMYTYGCRESAILRRHLCEEQKWDLPVSKDKNNYFAIRPKGDIADLKVVAPGYEEYNVAVGDFRAFSSSTRNEGHTVGNENWVVYSAGPGRLGVCIWRNNRCRNDRDQDVTDQLKFQ
jgi:hypothetical protein